MVDLLPEHYRTLLAKDRKQNEDKARKLFDWTMRQGRHWLDTTTLMVFQFILWRTYYYHKSAELISKSQFMRGVWDGKTSESNCAPATNSTHTLYKAIAALEELGFIKQTNIRVNGADVISLFEIDCKTVLDHSKILEQDMSHLRVSKKRTAQIIDFPGGGDSILSGRPWSKNAPPTVEQICTTEEVQIQGTSRNTNTKNLGRSEPRNVAVLDAIAKATNKTRALREVKVARSARGATISLTDLNATWQKVMIKAYGSCTIAGMTHREFGIFKKVTKTHTMSVSWEEFLTWVVGNWATINKESKGLSDYRKRKSGDWSLKQEEVIYLGSAAPDLSMMARNFGKLLKRYSDTTLSRRNTPVVAEVSEESHRLRAELRASRLRERAAQQALAEATQARKAPERVRRTRPTVNTIDPEGDKFFEGDDELGGWK